MAAKPDMFNCHTCTPSKKKGLGCDGNAESPIAIDGIEYKTCPGRIITPFTWYLIRLYGHYKNGYMLFSGGVIDQPQKYMQAMELIDREINKVEKK